MRLALLGVGNAGVRLVEQLHGAEGSDSPISGDNVLVINTTPSAFAETDHIADHQQLLIGDTHPDVQQPTADANTNSGSDEDVDSGSDEDTDSDTESPTREGVGGDPELGAAVARQELPEIRRALDVVDDTEVDAALVVAGLGGGTGCGVGSVLLEELTSIYEIPIYVLGVLPSEAESDKRAWTAARGIRTVVPMADAVFPIDNETWHDPGDDYTAVNEMVTERILSLFETREATTEPLPELCVDPNDIERTLAVGGVSTLAHVETELDVEPEGWITRLRKLLGMEASRQPAQSDATTIKSLVECAVESDFSLPCEISSTDRVLLILSGPPRELSRKGFEVGRSLLEDETGTVEILAGDNPDSAATAVSVTLLLSNVTDVPRIEALQRRAIAYQTKKALQSAIIETDHTVEDEIADDIHTARPFDEQLVATDAVDSGENTDSATESNETDQTDEHGFRFEDDNSATTDAWIENDETTTETPSANTADEPTDTATAEKTTNESSIAEETTNESASGDDEPNIKDPFAGETTEDEPRQQ